MNWKRSAAHFTEMKRGVRACFRHPHFAAAIMVSAAIGIGSSVGITAYIDALFWKPLPYRDSGRLVRVSGVEPLIVNIPLSGPDLQDLKRRAQSVEEWMAYDNYATFDIVSDAEPIHIVGAAVSPNFFQFLGSSPVLGRPFLAAEETPGSDQVVVISFEFWQSYFGGNKNVLGASLQLNGRTFTVIGVMPKGFWFPGMRKVPFWVPLSRKPLQLNAGDLSLRGNHWIKVLARLKRNVSFRQAQRELDAITYRMHHEYPATDRDVRWVVQPLRTWMNEEVNNTAPPLLTLSFLFITTACVNTAILMLLRFLVRRSEAATRLALGANRIYLFYEECGRLLIPLLVGGALGTFGSLTLIKTMPLPISDTAPLLQSISIDARTAISFALLVLISATVASLAVVWATTRGNLANSLGSRSGTLGASSVSSALKYLTACQVGVTTILLVGALALLEHLERVQSIDPGFVAEHVLTAELALSPVRYSSEQRRVQFAQEVLTELRSMAEVRAAAIAHYLPFAGMHGNGRFSISGDQHGDWTGPPAEGNSVSSGYFNAMRIPLLAGRDFNDNDTATAEQVVIISQSIADRFYKEQPAIGRPIWLEGGGKAKVIGIVGNVKRVRLNDPTLFYIYTPYQQNASRTFFLVARASADPFSILGSLKSAIRRTDNQQSISNLASMQDRIEESLSAPRFHTRFMILCGSASLVLALIGVYGAVTYILSKRMVEIGVRIAMGANTRDLLRLFLSGTFRSALIGVLGGIVLALWLRTALAKWTGVEISANPVVFTIAPLFVIFVTLCAAAFPVWRASQILPAEALRDQ